jgi:hypothetical protein
LQQANVIPEVFHTLSPLVIILVGGLLGGMLEALAAATICAMQARREGAEGLGQFGPIGDAEFGFVECSDDVLKFLGQVDVLFGDAISPGDEFVPHVFEDARLGLVAIVLGEAVDGFDHGLGVAQAREFSPEVAVAGVFLLVDFFEGSSR